MIIIAALLIDNLLCTCILQKIDVIRNPCLNIHVSFIYLNIVPHFLHAQASFLSFIVYKWTSLRFFELIEPNSLHESVTCALYLEELLSWINALLLLSLNFKFYVKAYVKIEKEHELKRCLQYARFFPAPFICSIPSAPWSQNSGRPLMCENSVGPKANTRWITYRSCQLLMQNMVA